MDKKMAPSQHPQARTTISGSKNLRVSLKGKVGVKRSRARARCAPTFRAARESATVYMMTASRAMNEYPPSRCIVDVKEGTEEYGWFTGVGRLLERARKTSRMKDEKEVKEPQKPVARPIYSGIVFFVFACAFLAASGSVFSCSKAVSLVCATIFSRPHSSRNNRLSSARKPMTNEPPTLAQSTGVTRGAPG